MKIGQTLRLARLERQFATGRRATAVVLCEPYNDLTIPSVIFLASPKSIIVLSR